MKFNFLPLAAGAMIFCPWSATAAITMPLSGFVNTEVPDGDPSGLASIISVAGSGQAVASVEVTMVTLNGWNGDIYVYLEHNGVISVLLNRPGRTAGNSYGSASSGMQLHFADSSAVDIHTGISPVFGETATGTFQPDARAADPDVVTDASPRSLFLSGFNGQDPGGEWTLFVADLSAGDVSTLQSWTLSITLVPEPSSVILLMLGASGMLLVRCRERRMP